MQQESVTILECQEDLKFVYNKPEHSTQSVNSHHRHSRVVWVRNHICSLLLSMPVVSPAFYAPNAQIISNTTNKLLRRSDNDGGLKTSTKVGIAIGLSESDSRFFLLVLLETDLLPQVCFVSILVSFWFIWRLRKKPQETTEDDIFAQETLARWEDNVLHGNRGSGSAKKADHERDHTRRTSESTLATISTLDTADEIQLSKPQQARIAEHV